MTILFKIYDIQNFILELHNFRRLLVNVIQIDTSIMGENPTNLHQATLSHQTSKPKLPKIRRRLTQLNIDKSNVNLKRSTSI